MTDHSHVQIKRLIDPLHNLLPPHKEGPIHHSNIRHDDKIHLSPLLLLSPDVLLLAAVFSLLFCCVMCTVVAVVVAVECWDWRVAGWALLKNQSFSATPSKEQRLHLSTVTLLFVGGFLVFSFRLYARTPIMRALL